MLHQICSLILFIPTLQPTATYLQDSIGPSVDTAHELGSLLAVRCPRLHDLGLQHVRDGFDISSLFGFGTSSLSGTAALLDALAASPVIKLRSLQLPQLLASAAVFTAIERLSVGEGAVLRTLHVRSVPADSVQHLRAIHLLCLSTLPDLNRLSTWRFPTCMHCLWGCYPLPCQLPPSRSCLCCCSVPSCHASALCSLCALCQMVVCPLLSSVSWVQACMLRWSRMMRLQLRVWAYGSCRQIASRLCQSGL